MPLSSFSKKDYVYSSETINQSMPGVKIVKESENPVLTYMYTIWSLVKLTYSQILIVQNAACSGVEELNKI